MTRETWYVMDDGSFGDPNDIFHGNDGRLRHKDGRAVAYGPHGPRSSGVDVEAEREKSARRDMQAAAASMEPEAEAAPVKHTADMKPVAGKGYRTRKAD